MAPTLSLEFTEHECKVVVADQTKTGLSVKSLSTFDLPKPDDAAARASERTQALRDHLKANGITAKQAVIVIPKNYVMARSVTLPSTVDEEIAGMAKFEAERHIPFNADRHIVSYHVLARQGMQGSDVLLAAVDRPIAQEFLDICVSAGLRITAITVSSLAMFNSFAVAEKSALADRTVMVLNVGKSATDLVIATNGNVTFTRGSTTGVHRLLADLSEAEGRTITIDDLKEMDALEPQLYFRGAAEPPSPPPGLYDRLPGQEDFPGDTTDSATPPPPLPGFPPPPSAATSPGNRSALIFSDWLNKLLQEVKRTFEFASREFNCPMVNHIYLSGEGALIKHVAQYFQANFNVDVSVYDPLHGADIARKVKKVGDSAGHLYSVALGGAIARHPHTVHINLLPGSYTEARSAKLQQRSYIVTGVLALAALVVGYIFLANEFQRNNELLSKLQARNREDKARVDELRLKKERLRIIRENVQDDSGALDVLRILSEKDYFPDQVTLTTFDYKRGDYVKLQGDARDLPAANQLVNDMRNTGFFDTAGLGNVTTNKTLRNRPPVAVLGWTADFAFPKPEKAKPRSTRNNNTEDDLGGLE
jgi:type IV pilus assembly protein PilM